MLLSEETYNYITDNFPTNQDEGIKMVSKVVQMFFGKMANEMQIVKEKQGVQFGNIVTIYQRHCLIWDALAERLEKNGYALIDKGGFKRLIQSKEEFKELHNL